MQLLQLVKKPINRKTLTLTALGVLMLTALAVQAANPATSDGTFQIDSLPTVTGVDYQTDGYVTTSTLDPGTGTWFRLNATVSLSSSLDFLENLTIHLFRDTIHGADPKGGTPDGLELTRFMWLETTDVWSIVSQGALANWAIDSTNSDDPGANASDTSFEFSMRFQISEAAYYATDWNASVYAYDNDTSNDEAFSSETVLVTMNEYLDVSPSAGSFTWGTNIQVDSVNNSITPDTFTITVKSNRQWELLLKATDFTASGETALDLDLYDIVAWDEDGSAGGTSFWIRNTDTTGLGNYDNQAPMSTEAGVSRDFHCYLSVDDPGIDPVGGKTWTSTFTFTLQANT